MQIQMTPCHIANWYSSPIWCDRLAIAFSVIKFNYQLSRCVARRQSSKPRELSRVQRSYRVRSNNNKKFNLKNIFFWPRSLPRHPPTTPESFMHMGPAMCESIANTLHKSAVLGYQSLARFARSALIILPQKSFDQINEGNNWSEMITGIDLSI